MSSSCTIWACCPSMAWTENPVALRRRAHFETTLLKHGVKSCIFDGRLRAASMSAFVLLDTFLYAQKLILETPPESLPRFVLLCDDDLDLHPRFQTELALTLAALPRADFRTLHLCPGWLWGRKFRLHWGDSTRGEVSAGTPVPEGDISDLDFVDPDARLVRGEALKFVQKKIWVGGPIACLVPVAELNALCELYKAFVARFPDAASDVLLTRLLDSEKDFVCFDPQLGRELEQGGTTFESYLDAHV